MLLLSPRALVAGRSRSAHLARRLRPVWGTSGWADVGARRGGRWQLCFHLPLFPPLAAVGRRSRGLPWGGKEGRHGSPVASCCGAGVAPQPWGGPGSPRASWSLGRHKDLLFLLAVPSCEGGRTIWSPLRQPNKPGNAGQALQIPLTTADRRATRA